MGSAAVRTTGDDQLEVDDCVGENGAVEAWWVTSNVEKKSGVAITETC
jgi:hypothetical protein